MLACLRTATVFGVEAHPVQVEVDVGAGLPLFTMVGLPDTSVRESRDRVKSAIRNSGYEFPGHRITVNLAPADVRKAGSAFDLPIALGILAASGVIERRDLTDAVLVGELSLDGSIQPIRGALPVALAARRLKMTGLLLPAPNAGEAAIVRRLHVLPVRSLTQAVAALRTSPDHWPVPPAPSFAPAAAAEAGDLADVRGQAFARRALEVAAAGGHNLLFVGPPGGGKTMLARRFGTILPPLTLDESIEATTVHSVAGLLPAGTALLAERPFRAPHHTISNVALVGGGSLPRPGEISLAHTGVLFLDEAPEFDRRVLEVLRQPLEEGRITVARAARTVAFPARFQLAAAMNPCPCGFLGHPARPCRCPPRAVERYRDRLSGPLRDRIDLTVEVSGVPARHLSEAADGEASAIVRSRVVAARTRQVARHGPGQFLNAGLDGRGVRRHCRPDRQGLALLEAAIDRLKLSARSYDKVLKVARTIADLAGAEGVEAPHVAEALQYRLGP